MGCFCSGDKKEQRCLEYGGNCTALPDKPTCLSAKGCDWGKTNVSAGVPVCSVGSGHPKGGFGGEDFNCR